MMLVQDYESQFKAQVRCNGLYATEDTLERLQNVFRDLPALLTRLLDRNETLISVVNEARVALDIEGRECSYVYGPSCILCPNRPK